MRFPEVGDWVRWITPEWVKTGRVERSSPPSLVVHFPGDEKPTVFPWACSFMPGVGDAGSRLEISHEPAGAARIMSRVSRGQVGVTEAAASLGTTPKQVRAWLRSGRLRGRREGDRWVEVDLPEGRP